MLIAYIITGKPAGLFEQENPDWAPTQKMGHNSAVLGGTSQGNRYHRLQQRNKRMKEVTAARALLEFSQQQDIPPTHLQHDEQPAQASVQSLRIA